jgi:phosphopantothenoylcysteine synthetase/decarboxylase
MSKIKDYIEYYKNQNVFTYDQQKDLVEILKRIDMEKIAEIIYNKETGIQKFYEPNKIFLSWEELPPKEKEHYRVMSRVIINYLGGGE